MGEATEERRLIASIPLELWKSRRSRRRSRRSARIRRRVPRSRFADLHAGRARASSIEKLRKKYAPKLARVQERIDRAQEKCAEREEEQYKDRKTQTIVSFGATVVGALFGRKLGSVGNVGRAASAVKGASRAAREKADIGSRGGARRRVPGRSGEARGRFSATRSKRSKMPTNRSRRRSRSSRFASTRARATSKSIESALVWIPSRSRCRSGKRRAAGFARRLDPRHTAASGRLREKRKRAMALVERQVATEAIRNRRGDRRRDRLARPAGRSSTCRGSSSQAGRHRLSPHENPSSTRPFPSEPSRRPRPHRAPRRSGPIAARPESRARSSSPRIGFHGDRRRPASSKPFPTTN